MMARRQFLAPAHVLIAPEAGALTRAVAGRLGSYAAPAVLPYRSSSRKLYRRQASPPSISESAAAL